MTNEEAIAYFREGNENIVVAAKDENMYDYDKQVIEADCMRRCFEANEMAIKALEQQPKMGEWIVHPIYAHLICNKCLSSAPYDCPTNYCPHCGARMNGGGKE